AQDTSFNGGTGHVFYTDGSKCIGRGICLQSTGEIVVAGGANHDLSIGASLAQLVLRRKADGTADTSWAAPGAVRINSMNRRLIRDGAWVGMGGVEGIGGSDMKFNGEPMHILCYNSDGSLKTSFGDRGTGGFTWIRPARVTAFQQNTGLAIHSSGKVA